MIDIFLIAVGGFFGSITRFFISQHVHKPFIGTWVANVSGSIFLGFIVSLYLINNLSPSLWLLLGIGFSGAYTTFSTFGHETLQLVINKNYQSAFLYVSSSLLISILLVWLIFIWLTSS